MVKNGWLVIPVLAVSLIFLTGDPVQAATGANELVILKCGIPNAIGHPHYTGLEVFKKEMEQKSNGRVRVDLFSGGQLGGERDLTEGIQAGTLDLGIITFGVAANFAPELSIFGLPFLFRDSQHYQTVVNGQIGKDLAKKILEKNTGLRIMGYTGPVFRVPFTKQKPLTGPADLKGLKIRTMEVPVHMEAYKALGASPVPIAYPELYTALQLGTVDGAENAIATIYTDKLFEQAKYVYKVPVVVNGLVWIFSEKRFQKLPKDVQDLIIEVMPAGVNATSKAYLDMEKTGEDVMKQKGITFTEVKDLKPFVDAMQPVWKAQVAKLPDWAAKMVSDIQAVK